MPELYRLFARKPGSIQPETALEILRDLSPVQKYSRDGPGQSSRTHEVKANLHHGAEARPVMEERNNVLYDDHTRD